MPEGEFRSIPSKLFLMMFETYTALICCIFGSHTAYINGIYTNTLSAIHKNFSYTYSPIGGAVGSGLSCIRITSTTLFANSFGIRESSKPIGGTVISRHIGHSFTCSFLSARYSLKQCKQKVCVHVSILASSNTSVQIAHVTLSLVFSTTLSILIYKYTS
jgi:hypothetical protein